MCVVKFACVVSHLMLPNPFHNARQEKVAFLAGGTDAEQLADLLMEKEDEVRGKDRAIEELEVAWRGAAEEAGSLKVRAAP